MASETAKCTRCGRKLTSARSVAAGLGPTCKARIVKASKTAPALADFMPAQVEQARELIEDGAVIQIRRNVWRTVSTDGRETYLTARQACTCPAGLRDRRCYHRLAVEIVSAA
jgi:hypothetical protein